MTRIARDALSPEDASDFLLEFLRTDLALVRGIVPAVLKGDSTSWRSVEWTESVLDLFSRELTSKSGVSPELWTLLAASLGRCSPAMLTSKKLGMFLFTLVSKRLSEVHSGSLSHQRLGNQSLLFS